MQVGCPKSATCRHRQVGYRSNFPNTLCLEASEAGVLTKRSQHGAANLLTGPGWKGETPHSIKQVIRSETAFFADDIIVNKVALIATLVLIAALAPGVAYYHLVEQGLI